MFSIFLQILHNISWNRSQPLNYIIIEIVSWRNFFLSESVGSSKELCCNWWFTAGRHICVVCSRKHLLTFTCAVRASSLLSVIFTCIHCHTCSCCFSSTWRGTNPSRTNSFLQHSCFPPGRGVGSWSTENLTYIQRRTYIRWPLAKSGKGLA